MQWDCLKAGDLFKGLVEEGKPVASYLEPKQEFILGTELETVTGFMTELLTELDKGSLLVSVDIETRYSSTIDCIGIAYQNNRGICIPFSTLDNPNFWTAEEEYKVFELLLKVLAHENIQVTGQNYAYDAQFIWKFWLTKTEAFTDTMILHHVLYNNMEKNLAFLASVYCDNYQYWKDDQQHG
jgi:DNA polymerase I-like protein with 3'-5' exonuclease and polymerase domains